MNHLGDTNKMVRDTPRTDSLLTEILDAYGYVHQGNCPQRWVNHARELERELNAANAQVDRLTAKVAQLYEGAEEQKQRIKRLEKLGHELRECASQLGWTSSDDSRWIERAESAVKAWDKEAKL